MKTYEVLFVTPHGNGWAIINSDTVSSVKSILENQSKFQPLDILHIKERKVICGLNTSIIYEGHCETLMSPYDLAVSQGYEGSLEEWLESLKGDDADVYTITITESYSNGIYSYTCDKTADEFYENVTDGNKKPLFYLIPYNLYSEKTLLTPVDRAASRNYSYGCELGYIDTTGTHLHRFRFRVYPSTTSTQAYISVIKLDDVNYAEQSDIPTLTSQLTNDSGFITSSDIPAQVQSDWNQTNSNADDFIKSKPIELVKIINNNGTYTCDKSMSDFANMYNSSKKPLFYVTDSNNENFFGFLQADSASYFTDSDFCFNLITPSESDGLYELYVVEASSSTYPTVTHSSNRYSAAQVNSDWNASSGVAQILNKPTLGTAAALDVPASGNASSSQVVKGDDTRLSDSRNAADVYSWAKEATKPSYSALEVGAIPSTDKGANGGVAELDSNGKVPSSQLPSYVDDVLEYASQSAFPATGESGKIYIALDTNKTYRWGGSAYSEISESLALGETSSTAYAGNKGKANADAIAAIKDGTSIDSFGDVETALADKINKSSTAGLVKNDGTIDTNTYLTQHQDISGKANKSEMSVVDGTGSDADKTTITLKTGTSATVLKSHQDISGKQNVINSSNKLSADYIVDGTTNKVINVKPDWNAAAGNAAEILNKPTIPDAVSGTNDGTNWTSLTIGSTTKNIPSGGSSTLSGLTDTNISNPSAGQTLKYNNSSSKWENSDFPTEIPSQTGNSGKFLTTNGSAVSWANLPSDVVYCTWNGSTCSMTVKEIYEAYLDGKLVICKASINDIYSSTVLCTMTRIYWFDESSPGMGDDGGFVEFIGKYTEPTVDDEEDNIYRITAIKNEALGYNSWTWVGGDYINLENLQDAISKRHSHSNKTQLDKIPSSLGTAGQVLTVGSNSNMQWANVPTELPSITGNASKILAVNSGATGVEWITNSGGGLTNYDFTHTANQSVSGSVTVTYAANTRGSMMVSASADLSVTFAVNNSSDNYLWIKNTGSSDIDILISSVTYNNSSVSNVYMPADGIAVPAGKVCEIGIVCNADGAFITSRSDLSL